MPQRLTAGRAVRELGSLAAAYNRVADSAHRARRQLEAARDAAQSANRLKDEFLTNVSHELRTPLNGVLGMTDLLLHTSLDPEQEEFALIVRSSSEMLVTIIDDILTFSQLQTGKLILSERVFNFEKLLMESAKWTERQAQAKGIRVEMCYPDASARMFIGDEMYIRQLMRQLCDNAVKFTDSGCIRIRFDCERAGPVAAARVAVEDTGIGITPNAQKLIFERFTQADGSLTRKRGGTGLGLALVQALIGLMGGHIGVESRVGEGSRFSFVLPLRIAEPQTQTTPESGKEIGAVPC